MSKPEAAESTRANGPSDRPGDGPARDEATERDVKRMLRGIYTAAELTRLAAPKPFLDLGGGCYVPRGFTVIYGPPKVGKTTLAVNWAVECSDVTYYETEGGKAEFGELLQAAGADNDFQVRFQTPNLVETKGHKVPSGSEFMDDEWEDCDTDKMINAEQDDDNPDWVFCDLLVFDTLANCFGGHDENATGAMGAFCRNIRRLLKENAKAVWVLHHTGKNGDIRGNSALKGDIDCALRLMPEPGGFRVECTEMRGGTKWPKALHYRRKGAAIERYEPPAKQARALPAKAPEKPASNELEGRLGDMLKAGPLGWTALKTATGASGGKLKRALEQIAVKQPDGAWKLKIGSS